MKSLSRSAEVAPDLNVAAKNLPHREFHLTVVKLPPVFEDRHESGPAID
jgi:hypothetical protein